MLVGFLPSALLSLALLCLPHALADLVVAAPSGAKVGQMTVTWTSNNDDPPLSSLAGSTVFLCAGGNTDASSVRQPASHQLSAIRRLDSNIQSRS